MTHQLSNAAVRCVLALVLVIVWVTQYDGPAWAWALLVVYIGFTVGMAYVIDQKIKAAQARARKDDPS